MCNRESILFECPDSDCFRLQHVHMSSAKLVWLIFLPPWEMSHAPHAQDYLLLIWLRMQMEGNLAKQHWRGLNPQVFWTEFN